MQIELTAIEVEIVRNALSAYEKEPQMTGLFVSLLKSVMLPASNLDAHRRETETEKQKADQECEARRVTTSPLRLKLLKIDAQQEAQHVPV
jgi:hypothetical protein